MLAQNVRKHRTFVSQEELMNQPLITEVTYHRYDHHHRIHRRHRIRYCNRRNRGHVLKTIILKEKPKDISNKNSASNQTEISLLLNIFRNDFTYPFLCHVPFLSPYVPRRLDILIQFKLKQLKDVVRKSRKKLPPPP